MTASFVDAVSAARPRVTAVVARLVGDDAEDVVQEAVLRAFLSLSQLREPERFESWLCGIALNVAKTRLRRSATERRLVAAAGAPVASAEPEPLAGVLDAVELLPPAQREAVLLHYVDGLSCDEVAAALGSTPGAVRVRLHRARAELRRRLAPLAPALLPRKETAMVELTLEDVVVRVAAGEPETVVWDSRIVVLRERDGERRLPIWIGPAEGNALAVRLREAETPRPLTYDLLGEVVRVLGGRVERAAITKLEGNTFFAALTLDGQELDARPSDAINVAVRTGAPIVAAEKVLDAAGIAGEPELVAKLDAPEPGVDVPEGEWRSLSAELLASLYRSR